MHFADALSEVGFFFSKIGVAYNSKLSALSLFLRINTWRNTEQNTTRILSAI